MWGYWLGCKQGQIRPQCGERASHVSLLLRNGLMNLDGAGKGAFQMYEIRLDGRLLQCQESVPPGPRLLKLLLLQQQERIHPGVNKMPPTLERATGCTHCGAEIWIDARKASRLVRNA